VTWCGRPAAASRACGLWRTAQLKQAAGTRGELGGLLRQGDGGALPAPAELDALLGAQSQLRSARLLIAAMPSSRMPVTRGLADCDDTQPPARKTERTAPETNRIRNEARADVFDYIERRYNPVRRQSIIGCVSPITYEAQARAALATVPHSGGSSCGCEP